jgi:Xaa-Pro aminopeptidase
MAANVAVAQNPAGGRRVMKGTSTSCPFSSHGYALPAMCGIADAFNGHIDEFRISHVQRSDGWIETTWNKEKRGFYYTVDEHETRCRGLPRTEFVDGTEILWNARMIKSEEEIAMMLGSGAL